MTTQLSLDGFNESHEPTDRLFFGILPDAPAVTRLEGLGRDLSVRHGLTGELLKPNRLHVTLCLIGDYHGLPAGIVARAKEATGRVTTPTFDVSFDRAASFRGKEKNPFVLRGGDGLVALNAFQPALFQALKTSGLKCRTGSSFTPHVTLLYDDALVAEHPIEPVGWNVREFVLIHSLLRRKVHLPLARWPLRD
jgi:2'-5' RNA ligase